MRKYVQNEDMKYIHKIDDWQGGIISIYVHAWVYARGDRSNGQRVTVKM